MNYRTVVVDDDENARVRLKRMLQEIAAPCELVGEASDGFEAIQVINHVKPDLVLLDIEMPGMNGIDVLRYCPNDPYIIFTTAHSDFAVRAFETNAISYLLKPIGCEELTKSIIKLKNISRRRVEDIRESIGNLNIAKDQATLQVLAVKTGDNIKLLSLERIVCIKAEGKYTIVYTSEKSYVSNFSISEMEERLNAPQFVRVHRSFIVNLKYVVELNKLVDKKFRIILSTPIKEDIIVSKNYYDLLKSRIGLE